MKIYYSKLQIELTRRCNQSCAHCCRGEAQDVDLTKEIVDAFFAKNDIAYIGDLLFSGGEPTLNGGMLEYFVDKVIENKIVVDTFMLSINGLSYSQELVNGLNKLYNYIRTIDERDRFFVGFLSVTQDQFHKEIDEEVKKKLMELPYVSKISKFELAKEDILPYGRALENGLSGDKEDLSHLKDYQKNYKIKKGENGKNLVIGYQYISANGNVVNDGCQSFDLLDEYAIGNVLNQSIESMYLKDRELDDEEKVQIIIDEVEKAIEENNEEFLKSFIRDMFINIKTLKKDANYDKFMYKFALFLNKIMAKLPQINVDACVELYESINIGLLNIEFEKQTLMRLIQSLNRMKKDKDYEDLTIVFGITVALLVMHNGRLEKISNDGEIWKRAVNGITYVPAKQIQDDIYELQKPIEEGIKALKK